MRKGWNEATLGDVADVIDPHPSHRAPPEHDGGVPFIGIGDVRDGGRTDFGRARKVSPSVLVEHALRYDRKQNLIGLGRVASIGLVVRLPTGGIDYAVSPTLAVLHPREMDTDFLFYYLQADSLQEQLQTYKRGSTRQSVGMLTLRQLKVFVPPLNEQKRIVDVVSSVDSYIDALQQQAVMARTARNAVLHELLSAGGDDWTEASLGEVCRLVKGISYKSDELVAAGEGLPFINLKSIGRGGGFRPDGLKWFLGKHKEEQVVRTGDLVLCCTDLTKEKAILGYPLLVPKLVEGDEFCISLDMAVLIVDKNSSSNAFMYLVLQGSRMREFMTSHSSGTTVMHLQTRSVGDAKFSLPPIAEQRRIVDVVSSMDEVIQATEQAVIDAKNLRSGLLSDLLSGVHEIPASYDVFVGAA